MIVIRKDGTKYEMQDMKNVGGYRSEHGKSNYDVKCPYCGEEQTVYVWSFAGSGKKCVCGALLTPLGAKRDVK